MIKQNDTQASSLNVLAEGELDQVVGGCCHGRRRRGCYGRGYGWGKKHGGYDKGYEPSYEEPSYEEPSYEEPSYAEPVVNNNVADVDVTITINQGQA
ncbi:MAG TPA: hypothetical protein VNN80_25275 [Polyangiaceae bacterium]|jgi:hypothetical protein|nr:hypothetical protein [Polyangiaceae bacterium]